MRRNRRLTGARCFDGAAVWAWIVVFAMTALSSTPSQAFDPAQSLSLPKDTSSAIANAAAIQKNAGLLVPNAGSTIYDTTAPVPGKASAPAHAKVSPVAIAYTGAADDTGSGVKTVGLWVKYGASGAWLDTGLTATGVSGSFAYVADLGDGAYSFALKTEDNAGNVTANPSGAGDSQLLYDTTKPVITLVGGDMIVESGSTFADPGATAADAQDGDITSKLVKGGSVNTASVGNYSLTYDVTDAAGNAATQVVRIVTVVAAPNYAVNIAQPAHGAILVSPAPGSDGKYPAGTVLTFTYQPDSTTAYDLTGWSGATPDSANATTAHLTVTSAPANVSVTIARQTGSVSVTVTPTTAAWTVVDGDKASHNGTGTQVLTGIPTGAVSITYNDISGMTAPAPQSATLGKGATVPFSGTYVTKASYTVSAASDLSGTPGQTIDCPISLSDSSGLKAFSLQISFDSSAVECSTVAPGTLVTSWGNPASSVAAGSVTISGAGAALSGGAGTLAVLRLHIKDTAAAPSQTAIRVTAASLNSGAVAAVVQDGSLSIQAGSFMWGDVDGDKTVGVLDADLILKYRTELVDTLPHLEAADVSGETPPSVGTLDASLILKKSVGAITKFPVDTNGDGNGPEAPAGPAANATAAKSLSDAITKSLTPRVISAASSMTLQTNAKVLLPIGLDNANGVQGYFFQVNYDDSRLEFVSIDKGTLTKEWGDPTVNPQPGRILIAGAGVQTLSGSGSLAVMNFKVRSTVAAGVSAPFGVEGAELNDAAIPVEVHAAEGAPSITSIAPVTGASAGGTLVTIQGTNLDTADSVTFGTQASPWFRIDAKNSTLQAIAPAGSGVVDLTVSAAGGMDTLAKAFTYFTPDVYLEMSPAQEVFAGSVLDVPVTLTTPGTGKPTAITFTLQFDPKLFAIKPSGIANEQVSIGKTAAGAGKSVLSIKPLAGKVVVTVGTKGAVGSVIPDGDLCTVHLLAISNLANTDGLLFVSDVDAGASSAGKSLTAAASALPARSGAASK